MPRARLLVAALLLPSALLAGCAGGGATARTEDRPTASTATASTATGSSPADPSAPTPSTPDASGTSADPSSYAVSAPGPFKAPLYPADVLVTSSRTLPDAVRRRVLGVKGVSAAVPLSLASLSANGRTLGIAAVDAATFRNFTPLQSARTDAVWKRVAGGEVAVDPGLPRKLEDPKGYLRLGTSAQAPVVHIGAYAPLVRQISAVVNEKRGAQLGIPEHNALLLSTGELTPSKIMAQIKKALGPGVTVQTLALEFDSQVQTAVLSGTSVTQAVGTFTYTPHPDGRVSPDPAWVSGYIRTEQVPILGSVTCNKGMLPQLRAALTEVVQQGLADTIHPSMYGGCYYPRFIAYNPALGLSLHSWGIAVDLNVAQNQRGTVGQMDRRVVAIFKKWGFAWGGDWRYTDPMHFELAQVVEVR